MRPGGWGSHSVLQVGVSTEQSPGRILLFSHRNRETSARSHAEWAETCLLLAVSKSFSMVAVSPEIPCQTMLLVVHPKALPTGVSLRLGGASCCWHHRRPVPNIWMRWHTWRPGWARSFYSDQAALCARIPSASDDDGKRLMLRWARLEGRSCNSLPVMCGLVQASRIVDEVAGKIAEVRCR